MPVMQVHYPNGALDVERKSALAQRLTDVLIKMEGGANTDGGRGFAWVMFQEVPQGDWWIGGHLDDTFVSPPGRFLVRVAIPEGYMNATHKAEVQRWVTEAISAVVPASDAVAGDAPHSIMVILEEVTEGNWAAGGVPISLTHIADVVGLPKDGDRYRWVLDYFGAKARAYAAAGYPDDTGTLLPADVPS